MYRVTRIVSVSVSLRVADFLDGVGVTADSDGEAVADGVFCDGDSDGVALPLVGESVAVLVCDAAE